MDTYYLWIWVIFPAEEWGANLPIKYNYSFSFYIFWCRSASIVLHLWRKGGMLSCTMFTQNTQNTEHRALSRHVTPPLICALCTPPPFVSSSVAFPAVRFQDPAVRIWERSWWQAVLQSARYWCFSADSTTMFQQGLYKARLLDNAECRMRIYIFVFINYIQFNRKPNQM